MRPQERRRARRSRSRRDELDALFGNGKLRKSAATLLAVLLFVSIMLAIVLVTGASSRSGGGRAAAIPQDRPGRKVDAQVRPGQVPEPRISTPAEVAERFLNARSDEERMKWVADPDLVGPVLSEFYKSGPGRDEQVGGIEAMPEVASDEGVFARFDVTMKDGRKRMLCLPFRSGGGVLVDFKSYSRYCSVPWESLLDGKVARADEMRLHLSKGSYYNHDFKDEQRWYCLVGSSPDLEGNIYLYMDRRDPSFQSFLSRAPSKPARHTVAIEAAGGSFANRQFILSRIIRAGWLER